MDTVQKLDRIAELRAFEDVLKLEKQALIDQVITPEIKAKIAEIEAEFAPKIETAELEVDALEAEIKAEVLAEGKSVKGASLMAVFNKGRAGGWDSGALEGMAKFIPQILTAKKPDGEPTVSFRAVK